MPDFITPMFQEKELSNLIHTQKPEEFLSMGKFLDMDEVNDFVETLQQFQELGITEGIDLLYARLRASTAIGAERARQLVQGVTGLIGDRDFGGGGNYPRAHRNGVHSDHGRNGNNENT